MEADGSQYLWKDETQGVRRPTCRVNFASCFSSLSILENAPPLSSSAGPLASGHREAASTMVLLCVRLLLTAAVLCAAFQAAAGAPVSKKEASTCLASASRNGDSARKASRSSLHRLGATRLSRQSSSIATLRRLGPLGRRVCRLPLTSPPSRRIAPRRAWKTMQRYHREREAACTANADPPASDDKGVSRPRRHAEQASTTDTAQTVSSRHTPHVATFRDGARSRMFAGSSALLALPTQPQQQPQQRRRGRKSGKHRGQSSRRATQWPARTAREIHNVDLHSVVHPSPEAWGALLAASRIASTMNDSGRRSGAGPACHPQRARRLRTTA